MTLPAGRRPGGWNGAYQVRRLGVQDGLMDEQGGHMGVQHHSPSSGDAARNLTPMVMSDGEERGAAQGPVA